MLMHLLFYCPPTKKYMELNEKKILVLSRRGQIKKNASKPKLLSQ